MKSGVNTFTFFCSNAENKTDSNAVSLTNRRAFFFGNDPEIGGLQPYRAKKGKTVLVGTSVMRSVVLVCQLANNPEEEPPQIILIDNSRLVHQLWKQIKKYLSECDDQEIFFKGLAEFLNVTRNLYRDAPGHDRIVQVSFYNLFQRYGYSRVKSIITETILIEQSFTHTPTFEVLRDQLAVLNAENVYVYLSNIVHCVSEDVAEDVMKNIALLNPRLSIHTDMPIDYIPRRVFLCEDSKPDSVRIVLFPGQKRPFSFWMQPAPVIENYFGRDGVVAKAQQHSFGRVD